MAIIGAWGDTAFAVSRKEVKTFDGLKWDGGANFATHDRHLKEQLLEFTGTDIEEISFSMFFSAFLGVNPLVEIDTLFAAMRQGKANRLIIGTRAYGTHKWVITKLSNALEQYDNHGNLFVAKVNVTMKSYALR